MAIDPELLAILACPVCRARLDPAGEEAGLRCRDCGRAYPIRDGIPVLLVDPADPRAPREEGE